jgi:hypothetical protein
MIWLRALFARLVLLLTGRSIGLNPAERHVDLDRVRRDRPELFNDDGSLK